MRSNINLTFFINDSQLYSLFLKLFSLVSTVMPSHSSCLFTQIVPGLIDFLRVLPLIAFPLVYILGVGDEKWVVIGVFSFFGILLLFSVMAILPTGAAKPGCSEKVTRYVANLTLPTQKYLCGNFFLTDLKRIHKHCRN